MKTYFDSADAYVSVRRLLLLTAAKNKKKRAEAEFDEWFEQALERYEINKKLEHLRNPKPGFLARLFGKTKEPSKYWHDFDFDKLSRDEKVLESCPIICVGSLFPDSGVSDFLKESDPYLEDILQALKLITFASCTDTEHVYVSLKVVNFLGPYLTRKKSGGDY